MFDPTRYAITRRSVLRTSAASLTVGGIAAGSASAEADLPDGFEFETVINMVEAGADPTGVDPVDPIVEAHTQDNTLLLFPPGTYRLEQFNPGFDTDLSNFGIKGLTSSTG